MEGVEIGYQQFFDFLPGPFKHLGFEGNYTFIDAKTPPPANAVAIYQDKGVEARLAYNWRSSYLTTYRDYVTGNPIYNSAAGFLDASLKFNIANLQLRGSITNILDTKSKARSYLDGDGQRYDRFSFLNDRRIVAGLHFGICPRSGATGRRRWCLPFLVLHIVIPATAGRMTALVSPIRPAR